MLEKFSGVPYVIVANKQDLPGALKKEEIREKIGLPDASVIETIAKEGKGVYEAFEMLAEKIMECLNAS
jgi:signal recognition particle receptor subunit beta